MGLELAEARLDRVHLRFALLDQSGGLDQACIEPLALGLELTDIGLEPLLALQALLELLAALVGLALAVTLLLGTGGKAQRAKTGNNQPDQRERRRTPSGWSIVHR